MKKLIALAIASTFALGSLSSFAAGYADNNRVPDRHERVSHEPVNAHWQKVKHSKKHARHHMKRHHHRQF